jgi:acetoin utilization protein AcuB
MERADAAIGTPAAKPRAMIKSPPVAEFMTRDPLCLDRHDTLQRAHELMHAHHIRHVVVVDGERIEGIVSERDLVQLERLCALDRSAVELHEALSPVVYRVSSDTPVSTVAEEMAERRVGSAVIVDENRITGIFTTTDALRALSRLTR